MTLDVAQPRSAAGMFLYRPALQEGDFCRRQAGQIGQFDVFGPFAALQPSPPTGENSTVHAAIGCCTA
jgi:hypothetical protein